MLNSNYMKKMHIGILSLVILCACHPNQKGLKPKELDLTFTNIDSLSSLSRLFENSMVKGNQILWPMAYQDFDDFNNEVSEDGYCHTLIDTTIQVGKHYYVIFRTDLYLNNKMADCHICCPDIGIAKFEKADNQFKLVCFKKHVFQLGGFGEYGSLSLDTLIIPCLKVNSGWVGTGAILEYDYYFDLTDFSAIFTLQTFSSNGGYFEENEANYEEVSREIVDRGETSFRVVSRILKIDSLQDSHIERFTEEINMNDDFGTRTFASTRLKK